MAGHPETLLLLLLRWLHTPGRHQTQQFKQWHSWHCWPVYLALPGTHTHTHLQLYEVVALLQLLPQPLRHELRRQQLLGRRAEGAVRVLVVVRPVATPCMPVATSIASHTVHGPIAALVLRQQAPLAGNPLATASSCHGRIAAAAMHAPAAAACTGARARPACTGAATATATAPVGPPCRPTCPTTASHGVGPCAETWQQQQQ